MLTTSVASESIALLEQRAVYWPSRQTLLVADLHWGKAASFRAGGLPVPEAVTAGDLARLSEALSCSQARRLVVLGDLWHARTGRQPEVLAAVSAWRARHPNLEWILVRGNHDRWAGDPPTEWGCRCVEEPWVESPFELRHTPTPPSDRSRYVLAGHVHPWVHLKGPGRQRLRLPCFHFGSQVGILPAFSEFTGGVTVAPVSGDRVFVLVQGQVIAVESPTRSLGKRWVGGYN